MQLVIFDCDGVLVDSERLTNTLLAQTITAQGWPLTPEACFEHFGGYAMPDVWREVSRHTGRPVGPGVEPMFRASQATLLADCPPVPGMPALVRSLTTRSCVASNGPPHKMKITLGAVGLLEWFDERIFSRTMVSRPKPAPDLFLYAAAKMGIEPNQCVVVEDSVFGIRAARQAGMRAIGFTGTGGSPSKLLAVGAHALAHSADDLRALLPD